MSNNWNKWIKKVESVEFPDVPAQINPGQKIGSVRGLVESHLVIVKKNNGNATFAPYMRRIWMLYEMLKKGDLAEN